MVFEVPDDGPRGPDGQRQALAPESLQGRHPKGVVEGLASPVLVEHVGCDGRYRDIVIASRPSVAGIGREALFGNEQLGRFQTGQFDCEVRGGKLAGRKLAGRNVHVGQSGPLALGDGGGQVVVRLAVEDRVLDHGARGDDADDLAVDNASRCGGVAGLLADGDAVTLLDELGEVAVERVVGDTRERHPLALAHLARREGDFEFP